MRVFYHLAFTSLLLVSLNTSAQENIEIFNFDIGQGDATLIKSSVSKDSVITVLFDTGGYMSISKEDGGAIINDFLITNNIKRIDYLVISHYDADHIGGLLNGGRNNFYSTSFYVGRDNKKNTDDDIKVINVVDRGDANPPSSNAYKLYKDFAKERNRISLENEEDLKFEIELGDNAKMICLAANGYVKGSSGLDERVNSENEKSISLLLQFKDFDYLISGDLIGKKLPSGSGKEDAPLERDVGKKIVNLNRDIEVLHVNHHGADNATEKSFLKSIKANVAVISCGDDNKFGHPRFEVLQRLLYADIEDIFLTNAGSPNKELDDDLEKIVKNMDGHIVIRTNGFKYEVFKYGYSYHRGYYKSYISK